MGVWANERSIGKENRQQLIAEGFLLVGSFLFVGSCGADIDRAGERSDHPQRVLFPWLYWFPRNPEMKAYNAGNGLRSGSGVRLNGVADYRLG